MSGRTMAVRLTANFERNLAEIEAFLAEAEAASSYECLLDTLLDKVIPNLRRFPEMGRDFLRHRPGSVEAVQALESLQSKLQGAALREYLLQDHLILYSVHRQVIHLLAIKHHRQMSFDFDERWSGT